MTLAIDSRLSPDLQAALERFNSATSSNDASAKARLLELEFELIDHDYDCAQMSLSRFINTQFHEVNDPKIGIPVRVKLQEWIDTVLASDEEVKEAKENLDALTHAYISIFQIAVHLIEYIKRSGDPATINFEVIMDEENIRDVIDLIQGQGMYVRHWSKHEQPD